MDPAKLPYRLRPATADDRAWLEGLRRSVYQELFVATFGGWDEARHARHCAECWALGGISLVELDGERVGMIQLLEQPDGIEIGEIQLRPSHQNRGIGSQLLRDAIARAHEQRRSVLLSLGLKNERAHRLYRQLGFRDISQSDTHYHMAHSPPRERAGHEQPATVSQPSEVLVRGNRFNVERRHVPKRGGGSEARELIVHPGSVVILPLLDDGRIVLIRNTRFTVNRALWELPAGTRKPEEPVELCAARELEEETGYRARELRELLAFYPAPGIADERMFAFVARGLEPTRQQLDDTEQIEVHPTAVAEVMRMIEAGEIEDGKTIATVLFWRFV